MNMKAEEEDHPLVVSSNQDLRPRIIIVPLYPVLTEVVSCLRSIRRGMDKHQARSDGLIIRVRIAHLSDDGAYFQLV